MFVLLSSNGWIADCRVVGLYTSLELVKEAARQVRLRCNDTVYVFNLRVSKPPITDEPVVCFATPSLYEPMGVRISRRPERQLEWVYCPEPAGNGTGSLAEEFAMQLLQGDPQAVDALQDVLAGKR